MRMLPACGGVRGHKRSGEAMYYFCKGSNSLFHYYSSNIYILAMYTLLTLNMSKFVYFPISLALGKANVCNYFA